MLNRLYTWFKNSTITLWYILTGAKKFYLVDPLFYLPIDANFKRIATGSALWTANGFAEKLLLRYGVCVHPSMTSGLFRLHPSISRDQLVAGYADMCMASATPFYKRDGEYFNTLPRALFVTAPLPWGWSLIRGEDWIGFLHLYEQRRENQTHENELHVLQTIQQQVKNNLTECDAPDDDDCSICLQDAGDWVKVRKCGHRFHSACILNIAQPVCPLCRAVIS
jgi:hypothetical protein